jgi:hypothetical protein
MTTTILIIYIIGYSFSAAFFSYISFNNSQKSYPTLAEREKELDLMYSVVVGIFMGIFWILIIPTYLLTKLFNKLYGKQIRK